MSKVKPDTKKPRILSLPKLKNDPDTLVDVVCERQGQLWAS